MEAIYYGLYLVEVEAIKSMTSVVTEQHLMTLSDILSNHLAPIEGRGFFMCWAFWATQTWRRAQHYEIRTSTNVNSLAGEVLLKTGKSLRDCAGQYSEFITAPTGQCELSFECGLLVIDMSVALADMNLNYCSQVINDYAVLSQIQLPKPIQTKTLSQALFCDLYSKQLDGALQALAAFMRDRYGLYGSSLSPFLLGSKTHPRAGRFDEWSLRQLERALIY